MNSIFVFDGCKFEIANAELYAAVSNDGATISWGMSVDAQENEIENVPYSPALNIEFPRLFLRRWIGISNKDFTFEESAKGTAYSIDHQKIVAGNISIGSFHEGYFNVSGNCVDAETLEFQFETRVLFVGVRVRCSERDTENSVWGKIQSHVDLDRLRQGLIDLHRTLDDGSRIGSCLFKPVWSKNSNEQRNRGRSS